MISVKMGQSPDSESYNYDNNGIPLIQGNADIKDRLSYPLRYTNNPSSKTCNPGDVLISVRAPVGTISKSNIYACIGRGIASLGNINEWLYQYFLFKESYWDKYAQGSTFTCINSKDIESMIVGLPCKEEQEKVGIFLNLLDKRIQTQNKIIEDLIIEKKIISDSIFSKPPLNKKILKNFYNKGKAGGTPKSTNKTYYDGNIPFLSISDMTEQGKYLYATQKTLSKEGLDNSTAWIVPENSLILSMYASVGQVAINKIPLTTSQAMFSMTIIDKDNLEFLYYYLSYFRENRLHKYLETGTQSNINSDFVKSIEIPDYGTIRNKQIVLLLSSFDNIIQKEKDILLLYKKQKAYLLQNMFI